MARNLEEMQAQLEKRTFSNGRDYAPGEIVNALKLPDVRSDILAIWLLIGDTATVGQALVQLGLALDDLGEYCEKLKAMDAQNRMLWSSLITLNSLLGSNYKISDLKLQP